MKIAIYSAIILGLMACSYESNYNQLNNWAKLLNQHLDKYPEMQAADIYKLIYQSIRGPGHLGADAEMIRKYLDEELAEIEANPDISLMETISPDSEFVRINLKKFKNLELPAEMLVQTIILSSRNLSSDKKTLKKIWNGIKKQVKAGHIQTDYQEFFKYFQFIEENNYPVVHHSKRYMQCYSPSYRVVLKSVWENNVKHYIK
ncbi:hypothetical protein KJ762_00200 [bacterium]|nr:hypothetical protein [bacterium]MBU1063283.1 hypothetical protein [bacterium]MBU1632916.1 hypothetical protein [bacterium]MBU1873279.1 hypothetical protein [bacterium]